MFRAGGSGFGDSALPNLVFPASKTAAFPVLISRSGHTSEVLQVAAYLRKQNIEYLALTCDGNDLASDSSRVLQLPVPEKKYRYDVVLHLDADGHAVSCRMV